MTNQDNRESQRSGNMKVRKPDSLGPLVPIILIATFVFVIMDRNRSNATERAGLTTESTFGDTAFLGGVTRTFGATNFRSGEAAAVMGGVDLDFRDARIEGDEARLDVTAIMGGVKIRVPRDWNVVNRVVPVLGGVENRTFASDGNKRLVVEGTVLMGGLEIKN